MHWSPLPGPGLSFHQSTYRILTRREGRRGAYFLRTYLGTAPSYAAQRVIAREVDLAPFTVTITGDPLAARYDTYTMRAVGERGQTAMEVHGLPVPPLLAAPFTRFDEMAFFLTQREEGYYEAAGGGVGMIPVEHALMRPVPAELTAARFTLWTDLELLTSEELLHPVAVLIQPSIVFTCFPPRLVHLNL